MTVDVELRPKKDSGHQLKAVVDCDNTSSSSNIRRLDAKNLETPDEDRLSCALATVSDVVLSPRLQESVISCFAVMDQSTADNKDSAQMIVGKAKHNGNERVLPPPPRLSGITKIHRELSEDVGVSNTGHHSTVAIVNSPAAEAEDAYACDETTSTPPTTLSGFHADFVSIKNSRVVELRDDKLNIMTSSAMFPDFAGPTAVRVEYSEDDVIDLSGTGSLHRLSNVPSALSKQMYDEFPVTGSRSLSTAPYVTEVVSYESLASFNPHADRCRQQSPIKRCKSLPAPQHDKPLNLQSVTNFRCSSPESSSLHQFPQQAAFVCAKVPRVTTTIELADAFRHATEIRSAEIEVGKVSLLPVAVIAVSSTTSPNCRQKATHPGCTTYKYNRRTSRRKTVQNRSHMCTFPGMTIE
jgi:hypothetical protein